MYVDSHGTFGLQAIGIQAIGIQCLKCGNVGGPVCACGWQYNNLFVGPNPNYTAQQIKATPLGYRVPDGFTSAEEFDRKQREDFEERLDRFIARPPVGRAEVAFHVDVGNFERVRRIWLEARETNREVETYLKDRHGRFMVHPKECWAEVEDRFNNIS